MSNHEPPYMRVRKRQCWSVIQAAVRAYWIMPPEYRDGELVDFVADTMVDNGWQGKGAIIEATYDRTATTSQLAEAMKAAMRAFIGARHSGEFKSDDVQLYVAHCLVNDGWHQTK